MGTVLLVAASLVAAGLASAWLVRRGLSGLRRQAGQLSAVTQRARSGGFATLEPGPVTLRGEVSGIDLVDSPVSETGGACYVDYLVEAWDSTPNNTGLGGKWVCVARDAVAAPFELNDGETSILVDPGEARLDAPRRALPGGGDQRVYEAVLRPGDQVVVRGAARHEGGFEASGPYRGHNVRLVVGGGSVGDGCPLVIAPAGRLGLRLAGRLALQLVAVAAAAAAIAGALLVVGNVTASVTVDLPGEARPGREAPDRFRAAVIDRLPGDHVTVAGPDRRRARFVLWTLGWSVGAEGRRRLRLAIRDELWRRGLAGVVVSSRRTERRWLLFELRIVEGVAFRRAPGLHAPRDLLQPAR